MTEKYRDPDNFIIFPITVLVGPPGPGPQHFSDYITLLHVNVD